MATLPLVNTFEGGSDTSVITAANSGGGSGDAFSTVNGVLMTYSSTHAAHGVLAAYTGAAQTVNQSTNWTGIGSLTAVTYFRMYLYIVSLPATTTVTVMRFDTTALGRCGTLAISSSGFLIARDAAAANIGATGAVAVPTGQWVRLEAAVTPGASANGTIQWRLYKTADSAGAADEDITRSGATLAANIDAVRYGFSEGAVAVEHYWDDVAASSTGWLGSSTLRPSQAFM